MDVEYIADEFINFVVKLLSFGDTNYAVTGLIENSFGKPMDCLRNAVSSGDVGKAYFCTEFLYKKGSDRAVGIMQSKLDALRLKLLSGVVNYA